VLGSRASPDFFHRFDPAAGTHRVAFAPFHVEAQARAADHAGQWMMAGAAGFLWVVANRCVLLLAVARDHRGVPVGNSIRWYGVMNYLLGRSKPRFHLGGFQIPAKPAKGVLTTEAASLHTGDFSHRLIIL